jgi:hypothetical protein
MKGKTKIFILVLVLYSIFGNIPSSKAVIQPPTTRYKYAFTNDPNLAQGSNDWDAWTVDGWDDETLHPESYSYITNGRWYSRLKTSATLLQAWDVVGISQGLGIHHDTYGPLFLGSNTTFTDAEPVEAVVFNKNETNTLSTDWKMYVRAKLIRKDSLNVIGVRFSLAVGMSFQAEWRNETDGTYFLSDYTNPDPLLGYRAMPWTVAGIVTDVFLISEQFNGAWAVWTGNEVHQDAVDYTDVVVNSYYGLGRTVEPGIWVTFEVPLKQRIEEIFERVQAYTDDKEQDLYYKTGKIYNFTLTSLILRCIYPFLEGVTVDVEAVVDYVYISTDLDATVALTVKAVDQNGKYISVPMRFLDDVGVWLTPHTDRFIKDSVVKVEAMNFKHKYYSPNEWGECPVIYIEFQKWTDGKTSRTRTVYNYYDQTITAQYEKRMYWERCWVPGGTGGLETMKMLVEVGDPSFVLYSPEPEYGEIAEVNQTGWLSNMSIAWVKPRLTFNNTVGSVALLVSAYHGNIYVEVNSIEELWVDLGTLWKNSDYQTGFGPFTTRLSLPDVKMLVKHENVSKFTIRLMNVPSVVSVKKNGILTDQWNYTDGDLWIWLYPWDHTELVIDFETPYTLTWTVLVQSTTVLIAMLTVAWLYKKLRNL